jgi:hypothetical protein
MNSKKLNEILNSHPLAPLMVLEAISRYSADVAESKPEDYPPLCLFHPESWIALGQDIQKRLAD